MAFLEPFTPGKPGCRSHIRKDHSLTAPHTKDLPLPDCSFHMMQARMLCHTFPGHPWACPQTSPSPVSKSPPSLLSSIPCAAQCQQESCLSFCGACAEEHGTTAAFPAPLPKALCCRTHSHLGTARLSWCHAGFTRGTVRERSPRPTTCCRTGSATAHQSAGAALTMLQTLPPISCWIPVSLPAPASAKQSVKIEAGLHQNTIVNCSPERSLGRPRIAPRAGEKECLPGGQV